MVPSLEESPCSLLSVSIASLNLDILVAAGLLVVDDDREILDPREIVGFEAPSNLVFLESWNMRTASTLEKCPASSPLIELVPLREILWFPLNIIESSRDHREGIKYTFADFCLNLCEL